MSIGRAVPCGSPLKTLGLSMILRSVTLLLLVGLLSASSALAQTPRHRVPNGFVIEQVAADPAVTFPMFACFDDRGRLFVAESSGLDLYKEISALTRKCRIRLLKDPDANGRFRKSTVWADNLVFPMGLVWRDGKLYVADPPDLITLEDTDNDGKADKRTVLLTGFGHRDNGSLHGLVFGPDGWLYLTMGDPDGYKLKRGGKFVEGTTGALLRCRPDGSDVEVLCSGFENLVEIAFTPRGEILGTDNWFQLPAGGLRDALVHLVPGGRYPRHPDKAAPLPFTGEPLPGASLFPAVALSGLTRYQGVGFPPPKQLTLFAAQHNARKVSRHLLVPQGSTFRTDDHDFVTTDDPDFHPSDVLEAADGSIYVLDTGSWYVHHCPTGQIRKTQWKGAIYRVRPEGPVPDDPWGLEVDWKAEKNSGLLALLEDRRAVVRERAKRTLIGRGAGAIADLERSLTKDGSLAAKQDAAWALACIVDANSLRVLRDLLTASQPADLQAVAARGLALHRDRKAEPQLRKLLTCPDPHLRLAAAEALARCGTPDAVPELLQALTDEPDRFLEHALTHALHQIADGAALAKALEHPHPRVQQAALVLLDQPPRPKGLLKPEALLARLASADPRLRQTAMSILQKHPEWADTARGLLRDRLSKATLSAEEQHSLRALILAFQGQRPVQELVAVELTSPSASAERRAFLFDTLAQTSLAMFPEGWQVALQQALGDRAAMVKAAALRAAATLQIGQLDEAVRKLAEDQDEPAALRLEALRAIILRRPQLSGAAFELLLSQLKDESEPLSRLTAAEVLGRAQLAQTQVTSLLKVVSGEALVSPAVLLPALQRSVTDATAPELIDYLQEALRGGWRPAEAELAQLLDRLPKTHSARAAVLRDLWKESREQQRARLAQFEPLLEGGSADRGRVVFFGKKAACATCHTVGNEGRPIGPDLTKVGAIRAPGDLLESIVLPSSTIAQGFDPYLVVTKSGRAFTGVISRQTTTALALRDSSGAEIVLPRDQIDDMRRAATSLMPEGLERSISREGFRDLLAFLRSLK
jgi:putative membrane-bound dehydrogenase-like protein